MDEALLPDYPETESRGLFNLKALLAIFNKKNETDTSNAEDGDNSENGDNENNGGN